MKRLKVTKRTLALVLGGAFVASALTSSGLTAVGADAGAFSVTKTVTRDNVDSQGNVTNVDTREVTVKADHTKDLQGRERLKISWSGAHPSGGRASNPFGENGLAQEYPVVVMQCRGKDDPSLPKAKQLRPETCWTSTRQQRSQLTQTSAAVWRLDPKASDEQRGALSGVDALPKDCTAPGSDFSLHLTPFVAADGTTYSACSSETMPPEAAVDASFPPAEQYAYTSVDGTGEVSFEARSAIENESLGCSDSVDCSIVVVPIMGTSCARGTGELGAVNTQCRAKGRFDAGSSNYTNEGVDDAVSPLYWWSASNWDNRLVIPISFGPAPNVCDLLDPRAPVGFYGSELMTQATLQWAPAYCLAKNRFKFQHNVIGDQPAFKLMQDQEVPAAFVSGKKGDTEAGAPEYAPTAVTGFAISYVVDKPDNAGEVSDLKLNARLLAKLLTQSYPASDLGRGHPGIEKNPLSINLDPEFQALNPGLDTRSREAAAVIMSLSEQSDAIDAITRYIVSDPDAKSFIAGKADPWGMTINPSYQDVKLPVDEWPLRDEYKPTVSQACLAANNDTPYLIRLAAPVTSFRKIADAMIDAWPLAQTRCTGDGSEQLPYVLGRSERQGIGSRMLLGVTTVGDAERYGLRTASLETTPGTFVGPTREGMSAAVAVAKQAKRGQPFSMDMTAVRKAKKAYPGTLVVYTAARTAGLDKPTAKLVGSFIRTATTEGQRRGTGNGYLPDGYLPLTKTGTTAKLWASAQQVASDIEGQVGTEKAPTPTESSTTPPGSVPPGSDPASFGGGSGSAIVDPPAADTPPADEDSQAAPLDADLKSLGSTEDLRSRFAAWLLPGLLLGGLLAGAASPVLRLAAARKRLR